MSEVSLDEAIDNAIIRAMMLHEREAVAAATAAEREACAKIADERGKNLEWLESVAGDIAAAIRARAKTEGKR